MTAELSARLQDWSKNSRAATALLAELLESEKFASTNKEHRKLCHMALTELDGIIAEVVASGDRNGFSNEVQSLKEQIYAMLRVNLLVKNPDGTPAVKIHANYQHHYDLMLAISREMQSSDGWRRGEIDVDDFYVEHGETGGVPDGCVAVVQDIRNGYETVLLICLEV